MIRNQEEQSNLMNKEYDLSGAVDINQPYNYRKLEIDAIIFTPGEFENDEVNPDAYYKGTKSRSQAKKAIFLMAIFSLFVLIGTGFYLEAFPKGGATSDRYSEGDKGPVVIIPKTTIRFKAVVASGDSLANLKCFLNLGDSFDGSRYHMDQKVVVLNKNEAAGGVDGAKALDAAFSLDLTKKVGTKSQGKICCISQGEGGHGRRKKCGTSKEFVWKAQEGGKGVDEKGLVHEENISF